MKLASIEKILEIKAIPNADFIVAAKVLGYWTVIKKGELDVDNLCVWQNPDTIVGNSTAYDFLKDKHLRVCRFKGQVSQGLALPLTAFSDLSDLFKAALVVAKEGDDVSGLVGITKYEKPIAPELSGIAKGGFPSFLKKTDEENLRSNPGVLHELIGKECIITQKIDGTSATFYCKDGEFGVCSRNLELEFNETNSFWRIAKKFELNNKLGMFVGGIAIQGEVYGPGVQGNHAGAKELSFAAFNAFSISQYRYLEHDMLVGLCEGWDVPVVPVVWRGIFNFTMEELIEMANAQEYASGLPCEGIVIRPIEEQESQVLGGRLSCKVISEKFALRYNE